MNLSFWINCAGRKSEYSDRWKYFPLMDHCNMELQICSMACYIHICINIFTKLMYPLLQSLSSPTIGTV